MSTTREELDQFHQFAAERLAQNESRASLDELLSEWQDAREREVINAAIRRGLADVEAGRHEPAEKAMKDIRQEFGFSRE